MNENKTNINWARRILAKTTLNLHKIRVFAIRLLRIVKKGDEIMYIWIGLVLEKGDEKYIRDICKEENKKFNISEQAFSLPQHISLKTSFNTNEYVSVIQYLKKELKDTNAIELEVCDLTIIDGKVIWLDIEENTFLRELHNKINYFLKEKFNIGLSGYDGENFKFHSTLFQEIEYNENINKIGLILKEKMKIPFLVNIKELSFGISEVGRVGTYKVIDKIKLKNPIDKLINDLKEPMAELNNMQLTQLNFLRDEINYIINNTIKDEKKIEKTFDMLVELLYWFGEEIEDLYFELVNYSKNINIDIANDYEKIYTEIINEEE